MPDNQPKASEELRAAADAYRDRMLFAGLVSSEQKYLYRDNPFFRQGIDVLIRIIPKMVDALVDESIESDAEMKRLTELLARGGSSTWLPPLEDSLPTVPLSPEDE